MLALNSLERVHVRAKIKFELRMIFCGGKKTGEPGEELSERGQEPTKSQTTHNASGVGNQPDRIGGRQVLPPLCHPCSPSRKVPATLNNTCSFKFHKQPSPLIRRICR